MSNPTSNFGWQMPTNTDLVSQLPADFEVFGQAVDTSLADLKGGTTGQVLKKNSDTDMDFVWSADAGFTNPMTTTGDTIYSSSGSTPARLGIGTTGQVMTVSGGVPSWATPSSGSLTQLATGTFSGSSISLTSISGSYRDLRLVTQNLFFSLSQTNLMFQVNSTSGIYSTSYSGEGYADLTQTSAETSRMGSSNTNSYGLYEFPDYTGSSNKVLLTQWLGYAISGGTPYYFLHRGLAGIRTTSAITSIQMTPSQGTFSGGTYTLYGVN